MVEEVFSYQETDARNAEQIESTPFHHVRTKFAAKLQTNSHPGATVTHHSVTCARIMDINSVLLTSFTTVFIQYLV